MALVCYRVGHLLLWGEVLGARSTMMFGSPKMKVSAGVW
jgi:hypothetical protein